MRPSLSTLLALAFALPASQLAGCQMTGGYDPGASGGRAPLAADLAVEIDAIATELAERAEARTPLGNARILVGQLDAIQPRRSPYRQVSLLERDLRATEATVRHELGMALGNRVNLVGEGAELATHAIEGEFLRTADALELSLRLVELESDWIVATARRRIDDFVPEFYDRRLQPAGGSGVEALPRSPDAGSPRTRALKPAYPSGAGAPVIVQTPRPSDVLTTEEAPGRRAAPGEDPLGEPLRSAAEAAPAADGLALPDGPIEFEVGPAAARLRAAGGAGMPPPSRAQKGSASGEQ